MHRHDRQMRVAGIGAGGQDRLARASVDVRLRGFAADVATRYLAGAGLGCLRVIDERLVSTARIIDPLVRAEIAPTLGDDAADGYDLRDPAARDLARGARLALHAVRAALAEDS